MNEFLESDEFGESPKDTSSTGDAQMNPQILEKFKKTLRATEVPTAVSRTLLDKSKPLQLAGGVPEVSVGQSETTVTGNIISSATDDVASIPSQFYLT